MLRRMIFPVLMGGVGILVLCSLGIWQVQRMQWKAGYLAEIEAKIAADPVTLPAAPSLAAHKYLPVIAEGRFTGEGVDVLSSTKAGGPGVRVIGVFETGDRRVLVDRGYLPEAARATPRKVAGARVEGNLQWPDDSDAYTPPPDARTGLWFGRDVTKLAEALNTEATLVVARAPTGDAIAPMPVDTSGIPNDHWGYAITWFALAAVWAGMTAVLVWRTGARTV